VEVNGEGRLEVRTPVGGFEDDIPIGYQEVDGEKVEVALRYALELEETGGPTVSVKHDSTLESPSSETYVYGFDVGDYDRTKPLILDPAVLVYCGYIGGLNNDNGCCIAIDAVGNAYVAGRTGSPQATFPVSSGPDLTHNGGWDVFVAKISSLRIEDLLGTWDGQGVYYKDSETGLWHRLESSPASQIAAGDLDGDGTDDLIGTWAAQPGVWVKKSSTRTWVQLDSVTPTWIAGGEMGAAGGDGFKAGLRRASGLFQTKGSYEDLSGYGPHGRDFRCGIEENAWVVCKIDGERQRRMTPGPREPGFRPVREKNRSGGKEKK